MNDHEMNNHESLVLTVSLYGSATLHVDIAFSEDRSVIDTKVSPVGKAVTSGMAQVVLDGAVFGSPEYQKRATEADAAIQLVITDALKNLAKALATLRDAPKTNVVHLDSLTPDPNDAVN